MRKAILGFFLFGSLCISGTASAHWMCSQGNQAIVQYPAYNSYSYNFGWGLDFRLKSGHGNWIHIPVPTGDTMRARKIRFRLYTDSADGVISLIHVYNGPWRVKEFVTNYALGWKEVTLDLGALMLFNRGLSLSFHTKDVTATGADHRFIFSSACAYFQQY